MTQTLNPTQPEPEDRNLKPARPDPNGRAGWVNPKKPEPVQGSDNYYCEKTDFGIGLHSPMLTYDPVSRKV